MVEHGWLNADDIEVDALKEAFRQLSLSRPYSEQEYKDPTQGPKFHTKLRKFESAGIKAQSTKASQTMWSQGNGDGSRA